MALPHRIRAFLCSTAALWSAAGCGGGDDTPEVVTFTVDRSEIASGESVTISYAVKAATSMEITWLPDDESGTPSVITSFTIEDGAAPSGSLMSPAILKTSTLTLTAKNGDKLATATQQITVRAGGPMVEVLRWDVSPADISVGESATLTWSTANAESGRIDTDEGEIVQSAISLPAGSLVVSPTATTFYVLTVDGPMGPIVREISLIVRPIGGPDGGADGGVVEDTGVDPDGSVVEPPLSGTFAAPGAQQIFTGALAANEVDYYRINVTAGTYLRAETLIPDAAGNCLNPDQTEPDTLLELYASDGVTLIGSDDDDGLARCSFFDENDPFTLLGPGTYYVGVKGFAGEAIPSYALKLEGIPGNVGDAGVPDGGPSPNFNIVATYNIPGPALDYSGAIGAIGEIDGVQINVATPVYLRAEAFVPTIGSCTDADPYFRLFGSDGVTELGTDDDDGIDRCPFIDENDGFALLAPGTYFLSLEELNNDDVIPAYAVHLDSIAAVLPDAGVPDAGSPGDAGVPVISGTFAAPGPAAIFSNAIAPAGEVDRYRIDVTQTIYLRAETFAPTVASGGCANADLSEVDTLIRVYAPDGVTELGTEDDDGIERCSFLDETDAFARLVPGTYYLTVEEYSNDETIPAYELRFGHLLADICGNGVIEAPEQCDDGNTMNGDGCPANCDPLVIGPDAGVPDVGLPDTGVVDAGLPDVGVPLNICGNGLLDPGESCDDGDTTNGDGCSAVCAEELVTFTAPGPTRYAAHSIAPAGDRDMYQLTVTAASYLRVETFAVNAAGGGCTNQNNSAADTYLGLFAADAVTLLAFDDNAGVGSCSRLDTADSLFVLAAGTYYLAVEETGNNATVPAYELRVDSVAANVCGNGVVEAGEQCEDGDATNGDGCSSTCQLELGPLAETEANGSRATADPTNLAGAGAAVVSGQISPSGDSDYFRFEVPANTTLTLVARTYTGTDPTACNNATTDTLISLESSNGTQLALNDDRTPAIDCSEIDGRSTAHPGAANLGPGTYYLRVRGYLSGTPVYSLSLTLLP